MDRAGKVINGTIVAAEIRDRIKSEVASICGPTAAANGVTPMRAPVLAVVLVGSDPGSKSFIAAKQRAAQACGIEFKQCVLPADATQDDVIRSVRALASDPNVDGIVVEQPLPRHVDKFTVLEAIPAGKDVDGLTSANAGLVASGREGDGFVACTARAMVWILEHTCGIALAGKHVVVINRTAVVGRPLGQLLLNRGATVTVCHSLTADLASHTKRADVIVTAAGKPGLITADMVCDGAVIIDGGFARVDGKVLGDSDFDAVLEKVSKITPPTGGVGPVTSALMLQNVLTAFRKHTAANTPTSC